jgi:hypothetical protein
MITIDPALRAYIAKVAKVEAPLADNEILNILQAKTKSSRHRSRVPIPPAGPPIKKARTKAFGGVLAKYIAAGDKAGYRREYARLWKLEKKKNERG